MSDWRVRTPRTRPVRQEAFAANLARMGFLEPGRAESMLRTGALALIAADPAVLETFAAAAAPDLALLSLHRVLTAADPARAAGLVEAFRDQEGFRRRLVLVLGISEALGEHLVRHPEHWVGLADSECASAAPARTEVVAGLRAAVANRSEPDAILALRVEYRRRLLSLAARDLAAVIEFKQVTGELADLADGVLEASLDIAKSADSLASQQCRLAVIALGKCGGRELNYVSDVDVIFVAEPTAGAATAGGTITAADEAAALAAAARLARGMMRAANQATAEGAIWEVDAGLRPEGRTGALVRTLASHVGYYQRWAATWEFQALLKARTAAGDQNLGAAYVQAVTPFIWTAADRPNFVAEVQAMRRRVEANIPAGLAPRQLKLGRGGLRDVEFSVQLLQLVHGRSDVMIRSPNTTTALDALSTWGYVGRDDAATLGEAYRFLRTLEHRMQLYRLQRVAVVPDDPMALRRLGRSLGMRSDPAHQLNDTWRAHARAVRRLHEKLFYRPLLNAVAQLDPTSARLTREAAIQRLNALGYQDPEGALRHLEALSGGVSRRAIIQRTLLPVMLGWFADGPDPDAGLLGFRQVSDALGGTPWYLRLLRDESVVAQRLANLLSTSRYASQLLIRTPDFVASLNDASKLQPLPAAVVRNEMGAVAARNIDPLTSIAVVRSVRRRELLRLAAADVEGLVEVVEVGRTISQITDAAIDRAIRIATREHEELLKSPLSARLAVIAMGRLGGSELGYGSDADVIIVFETVPGQDPQVATGSAIVVANRVIELLAGPGPEPPLVVDTSLRPEGRMGPLVRSFESYAAYYRRWSSPWEAQALLRARPGAGDPELAARFMALIDPLRYPETGIDEIQLREIRRLKARMESERLPRGADPALHLKLGRGGLSDVEWVSQLLQLRHGQAQPRLRTPNTLAALAAAADLGLIDTEDAQVLTAAWTLATRLRNAVTLVTGRSVSQVPSDPKVVAGVARLLGLPVGDTGVLAELYLRSSRQARAVVERLFYGWE